MAGQENQGDLWGGSLGLDLLQPTVCYGLRTLSLSSVQNLGSRDLCLTKLALDQPQLRIELFEIITTKKIWTMVVLDAQNQSIQN